MTSLEAADWLNEQYGVLGFVFLAHQNNVIGVRWGRYSFGLWSLANQPDAGTVALQTELERIIGGMILDFKLEVDVGHGI